MPLNISNKCSQCLQKELGGWACRFWWSSVLHALTYAHRNPRIRHLRKVLGGINTPDTPQSSHASKFNWKLYSEFIDRIDSAFTVLQSQTVVSIQFSRHTATVLYSVAQLSITIIRRHIRRLVLLTTGWQRACNKCATRGLCRGGGAKAWWRTGA